MTKAKTKKPKIENTIKSISDYLDKKGFHIKRSEVKRIKNYVKEIMNNDLYYPIIEGKNVSIVVRNVLEKTMTVANMHENYELDKEFVEMQLSSNKFWREYYKKNPEKFKKEVMKLKVF